MQGFIGRAGTILALFLRFTGLHLSRNTCVILLLLVTMMATGQTRRRNFRQKELGFFGGASYYLGDLNPRRHFLANHPAAGVLFRYSTNYRYAWRFGFNYGTVSGSDAVSGEPDQLERNSSFRGSIYELHALAEFHFVDYRIGHERHRFTMFVFAGLGGNYANPVSSIGGDYVPGQSHLLESSGRSYSKYQLIVPFGIGLKFNLGDKAGIGFEWGPRKTFTDLLDDVSGTYSDVAAQYYHPEGNAGYARAPGNMRGNPTTRDWYFFYGVTINFKLKDSKRPCHAYK